ncbi:MAG: DUF1292 domain-containing protein [Evtepia sp.]
MDENYGPNFITVTDENGEEMELEHLDTMEFKGQTYMAFFPAVPEGTEVDEEELGLIILKVIEENGEEILSTPDSDEELTDVFEYFMENLLEDEDEEDNS